MRKWRIQFAKSFSVNNLVSYYFYYLVFSLSQ
jgi:hypothetical protein